ncbi:MAG TPA: hypothetical protein PLD88_11100, partial [Candidatus Berkiella sp.]|nr:hypothetical protein [Candidatus Berkiella sp.]
VMQNAHLIDLSNFDVHIAWRVLLHKIKHNALYLMNDLEPEAGSEDEIEKEIVQQWKNFLGQLCKLGQYEAAQAIHNFIYLLHKTSLSHNVNKMNCWNLAEMTSNCIDDALEFTGKIGTKSNDDLYGTHKLKKEFVCITNILYLLIKEPQFTTSFDAIMYINSEQKEFGKEKQTFLSLLTEDLAALTCEEIKKATISIEEARLKNMPLPYNEALVFSKKEKPRAKFTIPKTFRRSSNSESPRNMTESTLLPKSSPRKNSSGNESSQGAVLRKSSVNSNSPRTTTDSMSTLRRNSAESPHKELVRKSSVNSESPHTETESTISLLAGSHGETQKEESKEKSRRKVTK